MLRKLTHFNIKIIAVFNNMRTLKLKTQLTTAFFAAISLENRVRTES